MSSRTMKVQELRDALEERGLDTFGTKAALVARLDAHEAEKAAKKREASSSSGGDDGPASKKAKMEPDSKETEVEEDIDSLTVAELRSALAKRGLSTAGTKKTLHSRLLESLEADGIAKQNNNDEEAGNKVKESKEEKDLDGLTVAELRSALAERGLSTEGTKKTLHSRLSEALGVTKPDDDCEKDDGKACDGKEQSKEENRVVVTKKGGAVLDNYIPDHVKSHYHVLETDEGIYDAMLNQTNVGDNNNKFYVIQVLESDGSSNQYYVYTRWGRVGVKGQDKLFSVASKHEAISEFEAKFFDKTKNVWAERSKFEPVKYKYTWLERDYGDDVAEASGSKSKGKNTIAKTPKESKLESRVAQFISLICNLNMMKQQMMEIGYDANKMPLGKLSRSTILKGYESLKKIAAVLDGSATGSLERLSSDFYTVIPHDFGFQRMSNFIIDTFPKLKRKLEMVEALGEIELASKLLEGEDEEDDVLYSSYQRLNCLLEPVDHDSEECTWIKGYLVNTHAKTHGYYDLEVLQVFKATRKGEDERFKKFANVNNRMLLWHGSRLTNWTGILSQGLRIAPPEAPKTGYMFGKGVYFADMVSKSANYCCTSISSPVGVLLLCEVALGDMRELQNSDYNANNLPPGKLSTKGVGGTEPNQKEWKVLPDGLIVPMGKPVEKQGSRDSLLYNEYIVYDVAQIRMRYVLQVKFNYSSRY